MATNRSRKQVRESRALGLTLTPKTVRYFEKRPYGPDEHSRIRRRQGSDYAVRPKEEQRLRAQYGVRGLQLRRAFKEARHTTGLADRNLVELLEIRLSSLVLRIGFAHTIQRARQFVVHYHILIDGKIVDHPSFRAKSDQTLQVKPKSQATVPFEIATKGIHQDVLSAVPEYLDVKLSHLKVTPVRHSEHAEVPVTVDVQMVVEHYSR